MQDQQDDTTPKDSPPDGTPAPEGATDAKTGKAAGKDGSRQEAGQGKQAGRQAGDEDLAAQLEDAEARAQEYWEKCLRATAEQDNIRKRAEREVQAARRFATEKLAQDLLAVRDSLELGLKAAREAEAEAKHIEGTELTLRMLTEVMSKHGIEPVDPKGEPFDPERHEAMSAVPTADAKPNTVIEVMQKGYVLNDRVLRPAMVVVAQQPPDNAA